MQSIFDAHLHMTHVIIDLHTQPGLICHQLFNVHQQLVVEENSDDDLIKWKHFPSYWPFVRGIHRSPVNSPHKGQWRGVLMFSKICAWIIGWVNNCEAGDLRCHCAHYDVTVMCWLNHRILCYSDITRASLHLKSLGGCSTACLGSQQRKYPN